MAKRILSIIAAALCAAACVYPFTPEVSGGVDRRLVMSGDIVIGEQFTINISRLLSLGVDNSENTKPKASMVIKSSKTGHTYYPISSRLGAFTFDLSGASEDEEYQLTVKDIEYDKTYVTPWKKPLPAPTIKEIRYSADETTVYVYVTLDGNSSSSAYRWDYTETWEYSADVIPSVMFCGSSSEPYEAQYRNREPEEDYYYCWNSSSSHDCGLVDTGGQTQNTIDNAGVLSIPRTSRKLSILYSLNLTARSLTKDAYLYYDNQQKTSNLTGDLFSPIPSEVRGNIRCTTDTTEMVYGYIDVVAHSSKRLFIDNNQTHYFNNSGFSMSKILFNPLDLANEDGEVDYWGLYMQGNAPVGAVDGYGGSIMWAEKRCTDCRAEGGSKAKPDFWPNDHK